MPRKDPDTGQVNALSAGRDLQQLLLGDPGFDFLSTFQKKETRCPTSPFAFARFRLGVPCRRQPQGKPLKSPITSSSSPSPAGPTSVSSSDSPSTSSPSTHPSSSPSSSPPSPFHVSKERSIYIQLPSSSPWRVDSVSLKRMMGSSLDLDRGRKYSVSRRSLGKLLRRY